GRDLAGPHLAGCRGPAGGTGGGGARAHLPWPCAIHRADRRAAGAGGRRYGCQYRCAGGAGDGGAGWPVQRTGGGVHQSGGDRPHRHPSPAMSRLLEALFGRLPIGWLQLTHSRTRFAAALAGVAFANVLVFVQLGIMQSMATATLKPYGFFRADVMISAPDANAMAEGGNVARQWMLQAMAHPDVTAGMGLFLANVGWQRGESSLSLTTFGVDPAQTGFLAADLAAKA